MNNNQTKSQFWRERLEAQKSSGLSIHTWYSGSVVKTKI